MTAKKITKLSPSAISDRPWWLVVIAGVSLAVIGCWILYSPLHSYLSLSMAFAAAMVIGGLFEVIFFITHKADLKDAYLVLLAGMFDLCLGLFLGLHLFVTLQLLPYLVGLYILLKSIVTLSNAQALQRRGFKDWRWVMLTGVLGLLLAFIILVDPVFGAVNIVLWTGLGFIFSGLGRILVGLKLRSGRSVQQIEPPI